MEQQLDDFRGILGKAAVTDKPAVPACGFRSKSILNLSALSAQALPLSVKQRSQSPSFKSQTERALMVDHQPVNICRVEQIHNVLDEGCDDESMIDEAMNENLQNQ